MLAPILVGEGHYCDHKASAAVIAMQMLQSLNVEWGANALLVAEQPLRGALRRSSSLTHHCSPVRVPVQASHHRARKCSVLMGAMLSGYACELVVGQKGTLS